MSDSRRDRHSYANPREVQPTHFELDLEVLFDRKILKGSVTHVLDRADSSAPLVLDTRDLKIERVETAVGEKGEYRAARFELGPRDPILGSALKVELASEVTRVRVHYETTPGAAALQWLEPSQTAGGKHPFLFTQSQAIHARSWIPLQDTPGVRTTYRARIRTPKDLIALMSARKDFRLADAKEEPNGDYTFRMPNEIPSYLLALAVGRLDSRYISSRCEVWAEPSLVEAAQMEFVDTERMIHETEQLYGPYQWLRYDILVLPPSFPFGGMENPLLTFATPTIIAGDKSLVSLIAHELAHSWSGNLVTNATWRDFWLNEGFTVYVERRILEALYGPERARMEAVLGRQELEAELAVLPANEQILHIDLTGRDPDDGVTHVPYEKGALFLLALEDAFGRERFDEFVRGYFAHFRFKSITTAEFVAYLQRALFAKDAEAAKKIPLDAWLHEPGIPAGAPRLTTEAFAPVDALAAKWRDGVAVGDTKAWTTHHWLHFLRALPAGIGAARMAEMDRAYDFTKSRNAEIACQWLLMAARNKYEAAYPRLEEFLITVGRRKFIKPLYEELLKTPEGGERAKAVFEKARGGYHPISAATVAELLKKSGK